MYFTNYSIFPLIYIRKKNNLNYIKDSNIKKFFLISFYFTLLAR